MKIIISLMILFGFNAAADTSVELLAGGLTYHVIDNGGAVHNTNKLSSDGRLISNPMIGVSFVDEDQFTYKSLALFGGQNSVGQPMGGSVLESGFVFGHLQLGGALGFYLQDDDNFRSTGANPFRLTEINGTGVVPIMGIAANYKIPLSNDLYLRINNIISPVITNTSLSVGWSF